MRSYLKQPMVADCEDIEALLTSDLVAALAGDEDAIAAIRTQVGDLGEDAHAIIALRDPRRGAVR